MADGPNHELNFEKGILNPESNLRELRGLLRFQKAGPKEEGYRTYQQRLKAYLPKLAKPEFRETFDEFAGDLEDKDLLKDLKASLEPAKEAKEPKKEPDEAPEKPKEEPKKQDKKTK